jgi:hypothetical protein
VTTSLLGKQWCDEALPISCDVMGHLGTTASAWLMDNCNTLPRGRISTQHAGRPGPCRSISTAATSRPGEQKLDNFHRALEQEDGGERPRELLDDQAGRKRPERAPRGRCILRGMAPGIGGTS